MALLIVFLAYSFLMFQAGYQWRKWARNETARPAPAPHQAPPDSQTVWNGMIGKI